MPIEGLEVHVAGVFGLATYTLKLSNPAYNLTVL